MALGRKPIFETPEQMQEAIDAYYLDCAKDERPVTICGLAFAIGMTRETLNQYSKKDKFSDTVKRAKAYVEATLEEGLLKGYNATGAIFNLKNNFGWKDKREDEIYGKDGQPLLPGIVKHVYE